MQGAFVTGRRPASKKAFREAIAADPSRVELEATSMFGNEYEGPVSDAPAGTYNVVGPDPYTKRSWYANVVVTAAGIKVK